MENSNRPAHPVQIDNDVDVFNYGLTKREYFAGLAMQSLISKMSINYNFEDVARDSVEMANIILKQLESK